MARKGENIYKRKDGRWEGRYKKGRKSNGQLNYGYLYGRTYTEVKERLYAYKMKYQTFLQTNGECSCSYEEWVYLWLSQQKQTLKQSTYSTYVYKLSTYVFPTIGSTPLNQLTHESLQSLVYSWQAKDLQPGTIHVVFQIMKQSLMEAYRTKRVIQQPYEGILLPKKRRPKPQALTKEDQRSMEHKAKALPPHKGLPVLLALNAGLRIGEIAALRWKDIDLNQKVIHIHQTYQRITTPLGPKKTQLVLDWSKTEGSNRVIPIGQSLCKYLKKWKKKARSPYVCSTKGTPSEPRLLTYYFHQLRKRCQLFTVHFHHLRHTFATRCMEANADIASISRLLGHSSTQTTLDIYTDSLLSSRTQAIHQMEQAKNR